MENIVNEPLLQKRFASVDEYLQIESMDNLRYELINGKINTIDGASLNHNQIVSNLICEIGYFLKGKDYEIFASKLRVNIPLINSFAYPDISIVSGKSVLSEHYFDSLLNPSVIIEVLSPATESYDRGDKLFAYQHIRALNQYILIDSASLNIQSITKKDDGLWKFENITDAAALLTISTINQQLPLADIYDGVTF